MRGWMALPLLLLLPLAAGADGVWPSRIMRAGSGQVGASVGGGGAATPTPTPLTDEILADGPVFYYRLNEQAGTTIDNLGSAGAAADGTISGNYALAQTSLIASDAADDSVKLLFAAGGSEILFANSTGYTDFTVEAWIKPDGAQATWSTILSFGGSLTAFYLRSDGSLEFWQGSSQLRSNAGDVANDVVSHVVFVRSGTTMTIYVNGNQVDTGAVTGVATTNQDGQWGNDNIATDNYNGWLDEAAFYNTALSEARIDAHYAAAQ